MAFSQLTAVVLLISFTYSIAHVILTYPLARKFQLDFLDNIRTKGPCGMPKGLEDSDITGLAEGAELDVTWHLSYPHRGGYRLEVIHDNGTVLHQLVPKSPELWTGMNDTTTQLQNVKLPEGFTCESCTLRLLRQAFEWGGGYTFWSCADIKVMPAAMDYTPSCSGNGVYNADTSKCECNKLHSGDHCEHKDECWADSDCGNHGTCIDTQGTVYPKMQCYCDAGWMGEECKTKSSISTLDVDMSEYMHRELRQNEFDIYWKHMKQEKEVDFILKVKSTTWVALGWKPSSITGLCQNFPVTSNNPMAEPEGESEGESESKATGEPETETSAEPETETTAEPETGTSAEPETETSVEPEQGTSEPEVTSGTNPCSVNSGTAGPEGEGEGEPTTESESEAETESEAESQGEAEGEGESEGEGSGTHPMDCTDIIIGSARGNIFRIHDYYTRDRSTPRFDSFYNGGSYSLTGAVGKEENGWTMIRFRRKIMATEPQDHTILNAPMTVIFARGQEHGAYVHRPPSGLETCMASDLQFYKRDELKYHGHQNQRGSASINFLAEPVVAPGGLCSGEYLDPPQCQGTACNYKATWMFNEADDTITFTVSSKTNSATEWVGLGISEDTRMANTDLYVGYADSNSMVKVSDRMITGYSTPPVDPIQNVMSPSGTMQNNNLEFSFTRPRNTGDGSDMQFSDTQCFYFIYAKGLLNTDRTDLSKHSVTPTVSQDKICISSCKNQPGGTAGQMLPMWGIIVIVVVSVLVVVAVMVMAFICYRIKRTKSIDSKESSPSGVYANSYNNQAFTNSEKSVPYTGKTPASVNGDSYSVGYVQDKTAYSAY